MRTVRYGYIPVCITSNKTGMYPEGVRGNRAKIVILRISTWNLPRKKSCGSSRGVRKNPVVKLFRYCYTKIVDEKCDCTREYRTEKEVQYDK